MGTEAMTGDVAIVTGAANGLGRAIAIRLSEEGATIVVADIDEGNGREVVDELKKNDRQASFVKLDLKDEADVQSMVATAIEEYKKIDILVNNAGIGNRETLAAVLNIPESEVVNWFTKEKQAIKKALKPADIANVVCWLVSEETRMMTGQAISIDGGHEFPTY